MGSQLACIQCALVGTSLAVRTVIGRNRGYWGNSSGLAGFLEGGVIGFPLRMTWRYVGDCMVDLLV